MMAIENFIYFNGNCKEAVEYYAEVFGLDKPEFMIAKCVPGIPDFVGTDEDREKGLVMYTSLKIKNSLVMFADAPNNRKVTFGDNVCLTVSCETIEETTEIFNKLKIDGHVFIDLQEVFFTKCLGSLTDKFGLNWFVVYFPQSR
ncbi:MAG: VOC family protein [Tannerella sp.]|jgi:PhnB protein|nr:VOC family protein [Tannerella sp.]